MSSMVNMEPIHNRCQAGATSQDYNTGGVMAGAREDPVEFSPANRFNRKQQPSVQGYAAPAHRRRV